MCTAHVLMIFCHRVDRLFVCKAKEGRYVRIFYNFKAKQYNKSAGNKNLAHKRTDEAK